ncbi:hypothetical protein RHRU231_440026 [Rhodococcus ruber]|uniref:Uncharacterized protein n=1 Tax=Rhodococcus ruber TaxID=1830 RepID=A0A098BKU3_9NOCA|nr:hypothetical protein RHRU231_440026 [Rhodococcus ruber]
MTDFTAGLTDRESHVAASAALASFRRTTPPAPTAGQGLL